MKNNKGFSLISKACEGFSLIEMLVVMSIFAVIGILTTTSVALTLRSGQKSDSLVRVRENVNYAFSIVERQVRNSGKITSDCAVTGTISSSILYISIEGISTSFTCVTAGTDKYIASGSGALAKRLTSSDISVTSCSFTCTRQTVNSPAIVKVNITAEDATSTGTEKGSISTQTEIIVRNY